MKFRIAAVALLVTLVGMVFVAPISAASPTQGTVQHNGAGGLVAATVGVVAQLQSADSQVGLVNLDNSLNNLTALNNVLNHNNVLDNNNVPITVQDISVLNGVQVIALNDALNALNVQIGQVVGVAVLSGGQLLAFAAPH
jgi:hypothetical protein